MVSYEITLAKFEEAKKKFEDTLARKMTIFSSACGVQNNFIDQKQSKIKKDLQQNGISLKFSNFQLDGVFQTIVQQEILLNKSIGMF